MCATTAHGISKSVSLSISILPRSLCCRDERKYCNVHPRPPSSNNRLFRQDLRLQHGVLTCVPSVQCSLNLCNERQFAHVSLLLGTDDVSLLLQTLVLQTFEARGIFSNLGHAGIGCVEGVEGHVGWSFGYGDAVCGEAD